MYAAAQHALPIHQIFQNATKIPGAAPNSDNITHEQAAHYAQFSWANQEGFR
jgi:hypothetical protein